MGSPPQRQDSTRPELPGFWQFYRPKLRGIIHGWWWAANLHNDFVGAVLLTGTIVVTLLWSTDALGAFGEYANALTPWLPRLSGWLPIALFIYAFLGVNYQRFSALEAALRTDRDRRVKEAEEEGQRRLALQSMEHSTTMSRVTGDWSARATTLEMKLASRDAELESARAEIRQVTGEREDAVARLRAIEEARPALRLSPWVRTNRDRKGQITGYQVGIQIVNERPEVVVRGARARIISWNQFLDDSWVPEMLDGTSLEPGFKTANLLRAPGQGGDFNTQADFGLVDVPYYSTYAFFAVDEPVRGENALLPAGSYGVQIEVSSENPYTPPVTQWFKLTMEGTQKLPSLDPWDGPGAGPITGEGDPGG